MEIKVSDKIVGFDYMVKTDTPEVVARECVRDFNFDQKYYTYVKDKIYEILNEKQNQLGKDPKKNVKKASGEKEKKEIKEVNQHENVDLKRRNTQTIKQNKPG